MGKLIFLCYQVNTKWVYIMYPAVNLYQCVYEEKHINDILILYCAITLWYDIDNIFLVLFKIYYYFRQKCQDQSMRKEQSLQTVALGKLDIHNMQENEGRPLPYTT